MSLKPVMSLHEVAEYIGCSKKTIYKGIKKGEIHAFKLFADSRQYYITDKEIMRITQNETT